MQQNIIEDKPIIDLDAYFCFSEDCKGSNLKNRNDSDVCLNDHAECVLSSQDFLKMASMHRDLRKIQDQKMLKIKINEMRSSLDIIELNVDSVYFVQNIPQLIKNDIIRVSSELHNNFRFDSQPTYRELEFTTQLKLFEKFGEQFQKMQDCMAIFKKEVETIQDESIKDNDVLNFTIKDYKILGNISEDMKRQIQAHQQAKSIPKNDDNENLNCAPPKKKAISKKKKVNGNTAEEKQKQQQVKKMYQMEKKTKEKRKQAQDNQKIRDMNSSMTAETILDRREVLGKKYDNINPQYLKNEDEDDDLIIIDEEKESTNDQYIYLNKSPLILLNTEFDLHESDLEKMNNQNKLKALQEDKIKQKQILHISENEQGLSAIVHNEYNDMIVYKVNKIGIKSSGTGFVDNQENSEILFTNVKKGEIQEFNKTRFAINLLTDGFLYIINISSKRREQFYKSEATITDFYSYLDLEEEVIYLFTFKQSLYKILKFSIHQSLKNVGKLKQEYSKMLKDQIILDTSIMSFQKKPNQKEANFLIHSQKYLFTQEIDSIDFYEHQEIPYVGYIYLARMIRYADQNLFAIGGIDDSISLFDSKYLLVNYIPLEKKYDVLVEILQISEEILLIVQKQGISLLNLSQSIYPLRNPRFYSPHSNIEHIYRKEQNIYLLFKKFWNYEVKKFDIQEIITFFKQKNGYMKQE